MNRHDRRAAKRMSRDATPDEIFPGGAKPIPVKTADVMTAVMEKLEEFFPGFHITMFLAEKEPSEGRELPRFNYMSTAERPDMIAVLKAFIAKEAIEGPKLERIKDDPPTGAVQ